MSQSSEGGDRTKLSLAWRGGHADAAGRNHDANAADVAQRAAFLSTLARTGDVEQSCRTAKMAVETAWALHQHDGGFRRQWDRAVDQAYANLELRLLAMALGGATSETVTETDDDGVRRQTTRRDLPDFARQILQAHRHAVAGRAAMAAADAAASGDGYATLVRLAAAVRARLERSSTADDSR